MLTVLDKRDLDAIHGATMEVLEKTGVRMDSLEALELLRKQGCEVDEKTKTVRMNESIVMESVKSCRANFRWHGRSEKHSFDVVNGKTKFGPGAQCLYYIDPESGDFRHAALQDGIRICRVLDALDTCALGYVPVYPSDVPEDAMSPIMWVA